MFSMRLVSRGNFPQYAANMQWLHTSTVVLESSSSSSSSDSDKKSSKKKAKAKPVQSEEQKQQSLQEVTLRLNNLLDVMIKGTKVSKKINLAIPPIKKKTTKVKPQSYEDRVIGAAKDAAAALGGDTKKIESELLSKFLSSDSEKSEGQAVKPKSSSTNLNDIILGMKIDRTPAKTTVQPQIFDKSAQIQARAEQYKSLDALKWYRRKVGMQKQTVSAEPGNLFDGKTLDLFNTTEKSSELIECPKLTTWDALQQREFKLALSHPPENIFQELIQWTEQGKLWKFPIDNEQGLEEEHSVHFSEHVFMERHLKDWCPKEGPIRHFMELVCVGLSKNPYMKVNEKIKHILWYREFFGSKQELLKEIGAINEEIPNTKQVEAQ